MQEACALLYRYWAQGTQIEALPPQLVPSDRAEAYAVQACIEEFTVAPLYGWKIAATSSAGQRHIGVDGPLAGRILAERVIADGGACAMGGNLDEGGRTGVLLSAWAMTCRRAVSLMRRMKCWRGSSPCIPRSNCRIRVSRISSARAWPSLSPTMPVLISVCAGTGGNG